MGLKFVIMLSLLAVVNFSCAHQEEVVTHHPQKDNHTEKEGGFEDIPFTLGVGDELDITVWNNDELTTSVRISPEGNINLPLTNEIKAEGLTIPQLKKVIEVQFSHYIKNPLVGINITTLRSLKVHVLGEVESPGTVTLKSRMLIWEAIAQTGGFSQYAKVDRVILLRREGEIIKLVPLDMSAKASENVQQYGHNTFLKGNDILYVAPTTMTKVARFMTQFNEIISPILNIQSSVILWPDLINAVNGDSSDQIIISP